MKRFAAILTVVVCLFVATSCGNKGTITGTIESSNDLSSGFLQTTATDDYDRSFAEVNGYNDNLVGIFYFLWLSQAAVDTNIDSFIDKGEAESTLTGDAVSMMPTFTYWGEPMYGYYQVEDEWVVRKHVELFINAGLDFICFDTTNNDYYRSAAKAVLDVLKEYHDLGYKVPRAMFMTNSDSTTMTTSIYNAFYKRGTYDDIWFMGNGDKPWILANYNGTDADILDRFYFRKAQWPNRPFDENGFPWISWRYPQETFVDKDNDYKIKSVSVSQHTGIGGGYADVNKSGVNFSLSGLFAPYNYDSLSDALKSRFSLEQATKYYNYNWGRGYSQATKSNSYENALKNINFEEQWNTIYDNQDINMVFVTGWNEWIAQKQSKDPVLGSAYGYFVDTYSMEFSRDVEMMNGGYLDNCFLQMVKNIRKYKGSGHGGSIYETRLSKSENMLDLNNWTEAQSYADLINDTKHRSHAGVGSHFYTNETGRNDIRSIRVADDAEKLYFLVETVNDITAKNANDTRWMNLFIGNIGAENGWNGLNYVVNRSLNGVDASIDAIENGAFKAIGTAKTVTLGKYMVIEVSKSTLNISGNVNIQFKVTDNLQKDFDITELYTNGDCAPIGRIHYTYRSK